MLVLTVNVGSSSVRLSAFKGAERELVAELRCPSGAVQLRDQLQGFLAQNRLALPSVVAHRVVHGGAEMVLPCVIDARVEAEIERKMPLAPLHNSAALAWIRASRRLLGPATPQVAIFDTAFYVDLPLAAATYALPRDLAKAHGIRRFGFHGVAHQAMLEYWSMHSQSMPAAARVISLQLGAGCSITATRAGRAVETSMGYSPLEGLVMATRCGDVDAGAIISLSQNGGLTAEEVDTILNHESGLLGVSGVSGNISDLLCSAEPAAQLAVDIYCHRALKYVGAYLAVLGGVDAILFGGGVGENVPEVRARILEGLEFAGIVVDPSLNEMCRGRGGPISHRSSRVAIWVAPVDEARLLAREALNLVFRDTHPTGRPATWRNGS